MIDLYFAPLVGFFVGLIVGMTGVGGGALLAPILLFFYGLEIKVVIATDLLFAAITKSVASTTHIKNSYIDWQIVGRLWIGSIPSSILILALIFCGLSLDGDLIITAVGGLIIFSGVSMFFSNYIQSKSKLFRVNSPESFKKFQGPLTVFFGSLLGLLVTLTSLGAGAIGVIVLRLLYPLRMKAHKLIGTDTIHAIPVSLIAGFGFLNMGLVNFDMLLMLLLGSIPGAIVGSMLIKSLEPELIKRILSIVLIGAGIKIII
tara:strand:- start:309 stop:1088 length:780 start_codon:yes stop_codon:yes gene_type:complete